MSWIEHSSPLLRERYVHTAHESGLAVYVFPKQMTGTYALLAAKYGSIDSLFCMEGESEPTKVPDGIAHFLEHKLFENEDGSDAFARFSAYGADANAYTTYNRTAYLFSCTDRFEQSLEELLTFVTHPYFTDASVKKEQGIIAEEIRMYEDNPWERCYHNLLCSMYESHPVRKNICGTQESIRRITPQLLYDCHRIFYHPSNMALVVCGDVEPDTVLGTVDRIFKAREDAPRIHRLTPHEEPWANSPYVSERMQVAKPLFSIGFKDAVLPSDPVERLRRDAAMTLLDEILFSRSERFYSALFEEGLLTTAFSFGYSGEENFAFNCLSGESSDPQAVLERLWTYLDEVRASGICEEAFERCRRVLYADEIRAYDSTEEIADRLLSFVFEDGEMFSYPELLQSVTRNELEDLLKTCFDRRSATLSVIEPLDRDEFSETDEASAAYGKGDGER